MIELPTRYMYVRIDVKVEKVSEDTYQVTCPYWEDLLATGKSPVEAISNVESVAIELIKSYDKCGKNDRLNSGVKKKG